jgi:hypothetical protein
MPVTFRVKDRLRVANLDSMGIGQQLFSDLSAIMEGVDEVNVSLAGIDRLTSVCLRHGVCPLIARWGWEEFQRRIHLVDATALQTTIWHNTIVRERARQYCPEIYRALDQQMLEGDIG